MTHFCRISYKVYVCLSYALPQVCVEEKQEAEDEKPFDELGCVMPNRQHFEIYGFCAKHLFNEMISK